MFFGAVYYLLPNLSLYSFIANAAHGDLPPPQMILGAMLYAFVYSAILTVGAMLIFSRKNFK
jgi:hypothetical protein